MLPLARLSAHRDAHRTAGVPGLLADRPVDCRAQHGADGGWAARADVPRDVERVVNRCLRTDPNRRFQTARDLKVVAAAASARTTEV